MLLINHIKKQGVGWLCIWYFLTFLKSNEYNEISWLPLMSLDKVVKEKDALRDSNSQLKLHINDLKASLCALKKILISCNHKVDCWKSEAESYPVTGCITTQTPSLEGCLLLKWGHWLGKSGVLWVGMWILHPQILTSFLCQWKTCLDLR